MNLDSDLETTTTTTTTTAAAPPSGTNRPPPTPKCQVRLAVCGSRAVSDRERALDTIDWYLRRIHEDPLYRPETPPDQPPFGDKPFREFLRHHVQIVSGGAKGPDQFAAEYSERHIGCGALVFEPDWDVHGRRAGLMRNPVIVAHATHLLALWSQRSTGTWDTMRLARQAHLPRMIEHMDRPVSLARQEAKPQCRGE